jgi:hypothetical protein
MRWLRWIAFVLFLAALVGYEGYALFVEEPDRTEHLPPAKDVHLSREVYGVCQLMQTFIVHAGGFSAIEIFPRKSEHPPGSMSVRVSDGRGAAFTSLVERTYDGASLNLNGSLRIPVPRVDDSAGGLFMLEIWVTYAERGHGLRFEQGGPTYPEGSLSIGCGPDWGDLKFRVEVQRPTIFSNVQHLRRSLPPWLQSDALLLAALFIGNWALAMVVYALAFAPDAKADAGGDARADVDQSPKGSDDATALQPRV